MYNDQYFMKIALEEAKKAYDKGEVPVGAVIVVNGEIVAKAHNTREQYQQALNHAEILVIKEACEKIGFWRLDNSYLYTTVEPCIMCSGAIIQSRIENVIFGAYDKKYGCCGSKINIVDNVIFNHKAKVLGGVLEEECSDIMTKFFKKIRNKKRGTE